LAQFEGPYAEYLITDEKSGIIFDNHLIEQNLAPGGLEFGAALPAKLNKPDYIGRIVCVGILKRDQNYSHLQGRPD
jgi:hypothetical protein